MVGWIPLMWIIIIAALLITGPKDEAAELERLDNIVLEVQKALEDEEYSHALRIADSIDYQRYDVEMERKWDIEREYWVGKVLAEASKHGVDLEYTPSGDVDNANDEQAASPDNGGFVDGFFDGMQSGLDEAQNNIDEFNNILNGSESSGETASPITPTTAPPEAVGFAEGTYRAFVIENYTFAIPNYWEEDGSQTEEKQFCAEVGESNAMLTIRYPEESYNEYDVSFDGLFSDNNNMIAAIETSYFDCSVDGYEVFESAAGVKGILYRFNYTEITGIFSSQEHSGLYFCFPSSEDRRWFYVILTETGTVENDTYEKDFMTMLEALCEN